VSPEGGGLRRAPWAVEVEGQFEQGAEERDAFIGRVVSSMLGTMDAAGMYLGERLGLYRALASAPATSTELAQRTSADERYLREWLEQQAGSGILEVDAVGAATERRYRLPAAHAEVLIEADSPYYLGSYPRVLMSCLLPLPELLNAFRSGGGVPYERYGPDCREGIAASNRPLFVNLLGTDWFPAIPELHVRLQADPPSRVADIGCGFGWSSIAMARAYPKVLVDGFDLDAASVVAAENNAQAMGLADRIRFRAEDAAVLADSGQTYDLVTAFETIHDMGRPVEALNSMRRLAGRDGFVLVVDERTADEFEAPATETERLYYGFSILHCLPVGLSEPGGVGTGTVMRTSTLRAYAMEAGFQAVEVLPIENDFWRFYLLLR
jgi:SAM-dependent methyltransferase